jgi:type II secretion system protein I
MPVYRRPRFPFSPHGGFTLLEVLVALALLSIALVVIIQLFSANLRGIAISEDLAKAVMKAESAMREALDDEDISEKSSSETTPDGYRIDVAITNAEEGRTENLPLKLLQIQLTVHWKDGVKERALTLKTMKTILKKV